ncbi:tetratricopeptide repeat protein [Streptomyces sp. NPDC047461]|uniref:tetratricopeptide repeat protein n=1 Tax=Streptomyces sp. NPDC047461 TaxID=3155619 RepID=UPI0033C50FA6
MNPSADLPHPDGPGAIPLLPVPVPPDPVTELERARIAYVGGHSLGTTTIVESLIARLGPDGHRSPSDTEVLGSAYTLLGLSRRLRGRSAGDAFVRAVEAFGRLSAELTRFGLGATTADYGIALQQVGEHERAAAMLARAVELGQDTPDVRRHRAAALRDGGGPGEREEAHRLLEEAVRRVPRDWQAWEWLAELTTELGRGPAEAAGQWTAAWRAMVEEKRFGPALRVARNVVDTYRRAVAERPDDAALLYRAARDLGQIGLAQEESEALGLLLRAADLAADARLRLDVADALRDAGDHESAARLAERVLAAAPDDDRALLVLVRALTGRHEDGPRLAEAARIAAVFLRSHPDCVAAHLALANVDAARQRFGSAVDHYDRVLAAGGVRDAAESALLHGNRGEALLGLGRGPEAVEELRTAAGLAPENGWIHISLARAHQTLGDSAAARAVLGRLIDRMSPALARGTWCRALATLGEVLTATGQPAEAVRELTRIPEPEALDIDVLTLLTTALLDLDRHAEALDVLRHARRAAPGEQEVSSLYARTLYRTHHWGQAAEVLTRLVEEHPGRWRDRAWLGEVERLRGNTDTALRHLDLVLKEHPDHPWSLSSRAAVYLGQEGKQDAARRDLLRCLDRDPQDLFSLRLLRDLLVPLGDFAETESRFRRAVRHADGPGRSELWRAYGETLGMLAGHAEAAPALAAAERELSLGLAEHPHDVDRLSALRELLVAQGRSDRAVDMFEKAARQGEPGTELLREHGETLRLACRYPEASRVLDSALRQATGPQASRVRYTVGRVFLDQGRYEEAAAAFDGATAGPHGFGAWYDGCVARLLAGQYTDVRRRLLGRLAQEPGNADAWWLLGQTYCRAGAWEAAVAAADRAVTHDPGDAKKQELLGWALLRAERDPARALGAFEEAARLDPARPTRREGRARLLWQCGPADEAVEACRVLLGELPPEAGADITMRILRGWCLARTGSPEEAAAVYLRSLPEANEERVGVEFDLAVCEFRAGRAEDAAATLKQAWLELEAVRAPGACERDAALRRRGILAEVGQDLRATAAHDPALGGDPAFCDAQNRIDRELARLSARVDPWWTTSPEEET